MTKKKPVGRERGRQIDQKSKSLFYLLDFLLLFFLAAANRSREGIVDREGNGCMREIWIYSASYNLRFVVRQSITPTVSDWHEWE